MVSEILSGIRRSLLSTSTETVGGDRSVWKGRETSFPSMSGQRKICGCTCPPATSGSCPPQVRIHLLRTRNDGFFSTALLICSCKRFSVPLLCLSFHPSEWDLSSGYPVWSVTFGAEGTVDFRVHFGLSEWSTGAYRMPLLAPEVDGFVVSHEQKQQTERERKGCGFWLSLFGAATSSSATASRVFPSFHHPRTKDFHPTRGRPPTLSTTDSLCESKLRRFGVYQLLQVFQRRWRRLCLPDLRRDDESTIRSANRASEALSRLQSSVEGQTLFLEEAEQGCRRESVAPIAAHLPSMSDFRFILPSLPRANVSSV